MLEILDTLVSIMQGEVRSRFCTWGADLGLLRRKVAAGWWPPGFLDGWTPRWTSLAREAELITVNAKHPLGALIEQAKKANGWSDIDVANRAKARGHELSKSNVARIRNDEVTTLVGKQLHALSAGLGIPVQQLAAAGLESMGIPGYIASATDAEQAVRLDPSLPDHVRRTLITIIRNERDRYLGDPDGAGTEEEQEPRTQARGPEHGSTSRSGSAGRSSSMNRTTVTQLKSPKRDTETGHHLPAPRIEDALAAREGDPDSP